MSDDIGIYIDEEAPYGESPYRVPDPILPPSPGTLIYLLAGPLPEVVIWPRGFREVEPGMAEYVGERG